MCPIGRKIAAYEAARRNLIKEIKKGARRQDELVMIEKKLRAIREAAGK